MLKEAARLDRPQAQAEYGRFLALKNCINAIEKTAPGFSSEQRRELIAVYEPIAADYREPIIRVEPDGVAVLKKAH